MSSTTATIESPSKCSTSNNLRFSTNGTENDGLTNTPISGNGVTAVVVTNPLASSSFSSSTSRYQSSVMNKYKNLATPDLTHPLSSLKQMSNVLTSTNGNSTGLDAHAYLSSKYVCLRQMFASLSLSLAVGLIFSMKFDSSRHSNDRIRAEDRADKNR